MTRRSLLLVVEALVAQGCAEGRLALGSDLLWATSTESGDLSAWTNDGRGGTYAESSDVQIAPTQEHAHSGRYALRIANAAAGEDGGGGLYREATFPEDAYYSAWYYVPRPYQTITGWELLRFAARQDASTVRTTIGLKLYSRPGGGMELRVSDYRPEYLEAPLADPPPLVPVAEWFQIEAWLRNSADPARGRIIVWIDGVRRYDLARPMGVAPELYFAVCSETRQLSPAAAELFVDDVAVSLSRVTPSGVVEGPP